jgi:asparagine synthase (glutamine-hydrolysing)
MQPQSFSAHFPSFAKDEKKHMDLVAQHFQLQSHFVAPNAAGLLKNLDSILFHQEEPVASSSVFAQWEVYALAKEKNVTVLLDGQGADEVLGGYHKYIHWFLQELIAQKKFSKAKTELAAFRSNGAELDWTWRNYIAAMMPSLASNRLQKKANQQIEWNADLTDDFREANYKSLLMQKPTVEKLNDMLYFNTMQLGLEELLRYADRNSMAHGCEVRLPFLNHELVQFVFSLPANMKMKEGFTKWILRTAMQNKLPNEIVWRKDKIGFEPPQAAWMQDPDLLDRLQEAKKDLVNKSILKKKVLTQKMIVKEAHAAKNVDWWYLCAANL